MNTVYEFGDGRKTAMPSDDLIDVDIDDYYGGDEGPDPDSQSGHAESDLPDEVEPDADNAGNKPAFSESGWTANHKQAMPQKLEIDAYTADELTGNARERARAKWDDDQSWMVSDMAADILYDGLPDALRGLELEWSIGFRQGDGVWLKGGQQYLSGEQMRFLAPRNFVDMDGDVAYHVSSGSAFTRIEAEHYPVRSDADEETVSDIVEEANITLSGIMHELYREASDYILESGSEEAWLEWAEDAGALYDSGGHLLRTASRKQASVPTLTYLTDPGHGWLGVPISLFPDAPSFSTGYSYYDSKTNTIWLEEDQEAPAFKRAHEGEFGIVEKNEPYDDAWVRSLPVMQITPVASRLNKGNAVSKLSPSEAARLRKFRATVQRNAPKIASGKRGSRKTAESAYDIISDPAPGWASWSDPRLQDAILGAIQEFATTNPTPDKIIARLGEAFAMAGGYRDSIDRERAFAAAEAVTGWEYDTIYRAWLNGPDGWGVEASKRRRGSRKTAEYNGWANRVTWNVALWIGNDEGLYRMALDYPDYESFADALREFGMTETPDGVSFRDSGLDIAALDEMFEEFRSEGKRKAKKRKVTAKQEVSSPFLPAGTYVVGDPCYAIPNDEWIPWLENADYRNNPDVLAGHTPSGHFCAAVGTEYGDGSYPGSNGSSYGVDAGVIGVVPIELAQSGDNQSWKQGLSSVETFNSPFTVSRDEEGTIYIGNNLSIQTGDSYEDDEDWDEDDYYYSSRRPAGKAASRRRVSRRPARKRAALMPFDIVAYTYKADVYMPEDLIERLIADGLASPGARGMYVEEVLDQIAGANAIDRDDESSFDSDEFPKVVFRDQFDDDQFYFDGRESRRKSANVRKTAQGNRFKVEYQGQSMLFDKERDAFQEALEWANNSAMHNGQAETVRVFFWEVSGPSGSPADQLGWDPYAEVTVKPIYEGRRSY